MSRQPLFYLFLSVFVLLAQLSVAQNSDEEFGRNRVQYEQFDWRFMSSDNFDVYFYRGGDKIAREVIEFLEEEFDRITDLIGYPPYSKTKLFLYNSVSDLQQSNVGIDDAGFSPGGETQFIKPYIEVAHPGSVAELKEELVYKVSSLMVNEMMFGGSLKDMFQSAVLLNLPEWFINGAALYVSKGWTIEMDDYVRELINTKRPKKLNRLSGKEAALAGQSLWNFIAEKYGRSNISNILNYTRIIRNQEKSITITLGIPFEQIMYEWQNYYTEIDRQVKENYVQPSEDLRVTDKKNKKKIAYRHVSLNPTGNKVAYTENNKGRYSVHIKDLYTDDEREVVRGGYKVIGQKVNYDLPLIDWVDSATLGVVHSKQGKLWFELYDYNTNSSLPRELRRFEQIQSMSFSDNGRLMIVSGMVSGRNDLYLLSTRRDRVRRISDDVFDDIDASFVPNTNVVVFSSNRISDTLNVVDKEFDPVKNDNYNLFFYSLDTTKNILHRVTNTISKDTKPLAYSSSTVYYASDQKGIRNIFKYDVNSQIYTQVTNYSRSIEDFDIDFYNKRLAFVMNENGNDYVYSVDNFDINQQIFTPLTPRQQVLQAKAFKARRSTTREAPKTIEEIVEMRLKEKAERDSLEQIVPADTLTQDNAVDTVQIADDGLIDTDNYTFETEVEPEEQVEDQNDVINTEDYTFETDVIEEEQRNRDSFLTQYRKLRQRNSINGPYPYEPRFSAKNLLTSFLIDPLRGFGIQLQTQMYDMLEDHKFEGGIMATTDLQSGDIFAEYHYLRTLLDFNVGVERNVILRETNQYLHKYSKNSVHFGAALPLNTKTRFSVEPFYSMARFEDLEPEGASLQFNDPVTDHYMGAKAELVYDNSIINGMNLIEGSRAKISFIHHEGINDKELSFSNLKVDLRHYQKIHREIVVAGRLFYGSFFGRSPKQYLLGGMDNWLFNGENQTGDTNPLNEEREGNNRNLLFMEYATNLRGFDYGTLYGNNTLLFNAELRIPLIRYLSSGPISSNFFRNLQFTGFFDMGSAWTGKSPFNEDNTISTVVTDNGGFTISLKDFQNPWLYSYGAGLRTMILGYYMKFDLAWPVEDYNVGSPRLFVTLGYDF